MSKAKPLESTAHGQPVRSPADAVTLDGDLTVLRHLPRAAGLRAIIEAG